MFKSTLRTTRMRAIVLAVAAASTGGIIAAASAAGADAKPSRAVDGAPTATVTTATPIKHLVVIFQENVSFDHYFGTYPHATNPSGEPSFTPAAGTPTVNGLSGALLASNPNLGNPHRWDRSQAITCDQDHDYTAEQSAFDHGLMDSFVQDTGGGLTAQQCLGTKTPTPGNYAVMDYYDGNTVTALWNYAQHFALNDNFFGTTFGPSTPGAINVSAGNTYGAICGPSSAVSAPPAPCTATPGSVAGTPGSQPAPGTGTTYSDADPNFDVCSAIDDDDKAADTIQMGGNNIGDLLDNKSVSWGWFQGGFASPGYVSGKPSTDDLSKVCTSTHKNVGGATVQDYSPHHEPFEYYRSTANPRHLPPTSIAMIGQQDQANHQYDLRDFFAAAAAGNLPDVSYLKAPKFQDGHAGYSDPLDEQTFLVDTINRLEKLPTWSSTAVVITYDDSDGWYDHVMGPVTTESQTSLDTLTGTNQCGASTGKVPRTTGGKPEEARCGVGPRLPALVISPYARRNFVDNTFTDQSSIIRFIEDNWLGTERIGDGNADAMSGTLDNTFYFSQKPAPPLFLDPSTGEPTSP